MFANQYHTSFHSSDSTRFTRLALWAGLALLFLQLTSTAAFSQGIIKTLDFPGAASTAPEDINDSGEVVGFYTDANNLSHGFLYEHGQFTPHDVQGSTATQIRGVNNGGDLVGFYWDDQNNLHGFWDHQGQVTMLDLFGVNQTFPTGINDQGTIVGLFIDNNQVGHYFVYANNQAVQLDIPNVTIQNDSTAWPKINNGGSIVGSVTDNNTGELRAALISNSSWMLFNVNGENSRGRAINSSGAITGFYAGSASGYVLRNGAITLMQVPGALTTSPLGINNHQQITGAYVDAIGTHGFIMQVP